MPDSFQMEQQSEPNWCWAAVSVSVKHYFFPGSIIEQCDLANRVLGETTCCDVPLPAGLDRSAHLEDALTDVSVSYKILPGVAMTFDAIRAQINNSFPVCARIGWTGQNRGHFVAVCGFGVSATGEHWVDIADPFFGNSTIPYDEFVQAYQGDGEWTDTFMIEKS